MTAEEEKDVTPPSGEAEKPAAKKRRVRKPAKAAKGSEAKAGDSSAAPVDAATPEAAGGDEPSRPAKKEARKPAAKKQAAAKAPARSERKARGKAPTKPRRKVVRAHARYVRTSARKARMVCGHLRGKSVQEARAILAFTPREVARDWSKLLESAVANAESNHELLEDDLIVREAFADEGPTIKRFRPRAMGRATPIRKRTSHLTIALSAAPQAKRTKRAS
jgi:ribosomal protein L22